MPIPEIADFENILSRIRLLPSKPSDGAGARSVQLPPHLASDEKGNVSHDTLWLAYPTDTKISFERLLDRIARDLSVIQHPNQRDFTLFVLAFSCVIPVQAGGHVARLNTILACICDADVNLY
jgi:hypothetical protein